MTSCLVPDKLVNGAPTRHTVLFRRANLAQTRVLSLSKSWSARSRHSSLEILKAIKDDSGASMSSLDLGEFQDEWDAMFSPEVSKARAESKKLVIGSDYVSEDGDDEEFEVERAYLVGVEMKLKGKRDRELADKGFGIQESLGELAQLAETAGLRVVGSASQMMDTPNSKYFIGSGKVNEILEDVKRLGVDTVIFDEELSASQGRNLSEMMEGVRVCDRTNLILDIFSQRARTKEGQLQVKLAMAEYQLPRLTRMWSHLERQAGGGLVKGMGEKQIEIDKRLIRDQIKDLKIELENVRLHREQYRIRRAKAPIPVAAIVGYTNAGKSTLLNWLTDSEVLAEDALFATLDPTTRRVELPSGKELLITDTVGFIQKLPTQLVAAFRATLEEIAEAALILHVVDASSPLAVAEARAVKDILRELQVSQYPHLTVWNKIDVSPAPDVLRQVAATRKDTFCISAKTGEGIEEMLIGIERLIERSLIPIDILIPYTEGWIAGEMHQVGVVTSEDFTEDGTRIKGSIPASLAYKIETLSEKKEEIVIYDL